MAKEGKTESTIDKLQKLKLIPKDHTLSANDQKLLETLSDSEVAALASVRTKLGARRLARVTKSGHFPHPDTVGF